MCRWRVCAARYKVVRGLSTDTLCRMNASRAELLSLALGEVDLETFAARNGMSPSEAAAMRDIFVEGLKAGSGRAPRKSRWARWGLLTALVASAAFAQLVVFQPDTPALASQVNANFTQLKTWLEAKVGAVTSSGVTATSVTTPSLTATTATVNGTLSAINYLPPYGDWSALPGYGAGGAGIVNDNNTYKRLMLVGNSAAGLGARQVQVYDDLTVSRNLKVMGSGGNTLHNCRVHGASNSYNAVCSSSEVAISGGGTCPFNGDSFQFAASVPWNSGANAPAVENAMPDSWHTECLIWGSNGSRPAPTTSYAVCCQQ